MARDKPGGKRMTSFTRRGFVASVSTVLAGSVVGLKPSFSQSNYPNRPITLICPWGAGGGTDATARIIAQVMEQKLNQPVNVVNRTGGNGVVGHTAIST